MGEVVSLAASAGFRLSISALAALLSVSRERIRNALVRGRIQGSRDEEDQYATYELASLVDVTDPFLAGEFLRMERSRCAIHFARVVEIIEATPRAPRAAIANAHYCAGAFALHLPGSAQAFAYPSDLVERIRLGAEDAARALLEHAREAAPKPKAKRSTRARRTRTEQ